MNKLTEKEIVMGIHICPVCNEIWQCVAPVNGIKGTEDYCYFCWQKVNDRENYDKYFKEEK